MRTHCETEAPSNSEQAHSSRRNTDGESYLLCLGNKEPVRFKNDLMH